MDGEEGSAPRLLPRGAGAEAPQGEIAAGNMGLEYTEQNFNALVAANTAMQGEVENQTLIITDLRDRLKELTGLEDRFDRIFNKQEGQLKAADRALTEERAEHAHTRAQLAVAEKRLERAKGYIDRTLDDEARVHGARGGHPDR